MVKMSLDPVQVMSGQVKELKVAPSSNGDSRGSWEEKEEFDQDHLGLTTKPKPVSLHVNILFVSDLAKASLLDNFPLFLSILLLLSPAYTSESDVYVVHVQFTVKCTS